MGYGSGVHKLYRRLHSIFGERDHPAMDSLGNVIYTKDGDVWEELNTPKNIKDHSYVHDGTQYTYETREDVRKGKKSIQRRKFLPTRLAIQDFLSKNETHQKNRILQLSFFSLQTGDRRAQQEFRRENPAGTLDWCKWTGQKGH